MMGVLGAISKFPRTTPLMGPPQQPLQAQACAYAHQNGRNMDHWMRAWELYDFVHWDKFPKNACSVAPGNCGLLHFLTSAAACALPVALRFTSTPHAPFPSQAGVTTHQ